jgi:hypothetical protein
MTPPPVVEDLLVFKQGVGELDTGAPALPVEKIPGRDLDT